MAIPPSACPACDHTFDRDAVFPTLDENGHGLGACPNCNAGLWRSDGYVCGPAGKGSKMVVRVGLQERR